METIYPQLAKFQQAVGTINKDKAGNNYKYASLDNIVEKITPLLKENELGFTHTFDTSMDGVDIICTVFSTKEGVEPIHSRLSLPKETPKLNREGKEILTVSQLQGVAITYARRYTLTAILGLVTDEDTDGALKDKKKASVSYLPWLRKNSPEFEKLSKIISQHSYEEVIEMAKLKYQVDPDVEVAIKKLYQNPAPQEDVPVIQVEE